MWARETQQRDYGTSYIILFRVAPYYRILIQI
jgi:hypothetical protein